MEQKLEDFHSDASPALEIETPDSPGKARIIFDILETLILSVVLFLGINAISARVRVEGSSMEPSFHDGEFVIVSRLSYRFSTPDHGDVVVFHYPRNPKEEYIKRVIGVAGDHIQIKNGEVYVNGNKLDEPYITTAPQYVGEWNIPENSLFVLGDNRNNSSDSHVWGVLSMDQVIGKAIFTYWPLNEIGIIEPVEPFAIVNP